MGAFEAARRAAVDALAFVLPIDCAGCDAPDVALCEPCRAALAPVVSQRVLPSGLVVCSGLVFDGVASRVVRALKEDGRTGLARPLAPALAAAVAAVHGGPDAIVPVPSSRTAMRRRGYAVVELLARDAPIPMRRLLLPGRAMSDQRLLGRDARRTNVAGAFRARLAEGIRIVLVDDVVTTGATLEEAARVLRTAGAEVLGAAVAASTPRRSGTFERTEISS